MKGMRILLILTGGLLLATPGLAGAYTASNGVVTDQRTGLVWQQQDDGQKRDWGEAIAYCEGLSLANQSDWRLPNIKELESITDDGRVMMAIDPIFTGTKYSEYWSSTTYAYNSNNAWAVYAGSGEVNSHNYKSFYQYVRCVRDGQ